MFRTLKDLNKDNDVPSDDEEEKKNVDWYAGGTSSGMAVDSGEPEIADNIKKIVKKAKENAADGKGLSEESVKIKIRLFSDGFTIDDGPLRGYDSEENKSFMEQLAQGYVPREIQEKYTGKKVGVSLEDKRKEKYRPPTPPAYVAYSGAGESLSSTEGVGLEVNKETGKPVVDESKPTTSLQIRFHNGERQVVPFNLTHTVSDIHSYVMMAAPVDGSYDLVTGFPPRPLEDPSKTIEEAGLKSAAITQKIL